MEENQLRPEVKAFADNMEKVLKSKDVQHPQGWSEDIPYTLFDSMQRKMPELLLAISADNKEMMVKKSTDIANFAMMIADKAGLGK